MPESSHMHDGSPVVASGPQRQRVTTTYEIVDWEDVPESIRHHFRKKAAAAAKGGSFGGGGSGSHFKHRSRKIDKKKTTCMLYLQADHLFYKKMGSEEASIEVMARHVQRVNSIYRPIGKAHLHQPDKYLISFSHFVMILSLKIIMIRTTRDS